MVINVAHQDAERDPVLQAILEQINDPTEQRIREPSSSPNVQLLQAVTSAIARSNTQAGGERVVDLIGHALDGQLHIGQWGLTSSTTTTAIFRAIGEANSELGLTKIRLLGCLTAQSPGGIAALGFLQDLMNESKSKIKIFGSTDPLCAVDFGPTGITPVSENDYLTQANHEVPPDLQAVLNAWWQTVSPPSDPLKDLHEALGKEKIGTPQAPLRTETAEEILASRTLYGDLIPVRRAKSSLPLFAALSGEPGREVAGLLELPMGELAVPVDGSPLYHRITLLFGGRFVRLYPREPANEFAKKAISGVTYRMKEEKQKLLLGQFFDGTVLPL